MANGWGGGETSGRFAALLALGGVAVAVLGLALAGVTGDPYLGASGVNAWLVVFAAGLLVALVAFPFGLEVRLRERHADHDKRWEMSLVVWGGLSGVLLLAAFLAGFDTATLAGAAGLIVVIEAGLTAATVVVWLLAGG